MVFLQDWMELIRWMSGLPEMIPFLKKREHQYQVNLLFKRSGSITKFFAVYRRLRVSNRRLNSLHVVPVKE